jgi:hypothetical protein
MHQAPKPEQTISAAHVSPRDCCSDAHRIGWRQKEKKKDQSEMVDIVEQDATTMGVDRDLVNTAADQT